SSKRDWSSDVCSSDLSAGWSPWDHALTRLLIGTSTVTESTTVARNSAAATPLSAPAAVERSSTASTTVSVTVAMYHGGMTAPSQIGSATCRDRDTQAA